MSSINTTCIQCDPLVMDDYMDLVWTSAAELPGKHNLVLVNNISGNKSNFTHHFNSGLLLTAVLVDLIGRKYTLVSEFLIFGVVCFCLFICMARYVLNEI